MPAVCMVLHFVLWHAVLRTPQSGTREGRVCFLWVTGKHGTEKLKNVPGFTQEREVASVLGATVYSPLCGFGVSLSDPRELH